ncbi:MAG: hypothetical protein A2Z06_03765, partial [Candidatus Glassbacteria bacterium RBG_16_58_8]
MNTTRVILTCALKEYLASFRLLLGFIIVVCLMASGALIYSLRYQQEILEYRGVLADLDDRIRKESQSLAGVVTMGLEAYRRPSALQFVVDGGEETLPNRIPYTVNLWISPASEGGGNYMLPPFEGLDWDFIVRVILSFVAIALTYDAVSGERERGTLRLIMANPVPRDKFLTGKLLAGLIALCIPLLLGALISVAILTLFGGIRLTGGDLIRLLIHLLTSAAYLSLFVLLGLIVSILARRSASSLVLLLLIWVCLVVAIPGTARPLATIAREIPSRQEFDDEVSQIFNDVLKEYEGQDVSHAPLNVAPIDESEYRWAEMMDKVDEREQEIVDHYWMMKMEQAVFARKIAMISPAGLYQRAGQDLTNSGLVRQEEFARSVKTSREALASFGRELD